jgi:hypothetical protein
MEAEKNVWRLGLGFVPTDGQFLSFKYHFSLSFFFLVFQIEKFRKIGTGFLNWTYI